MSKELYEWLREQWELSNHKKYYQYFKQWIENITDNQLSHFNRMRINGNIYLAK